MQGQQMRKTTEQQSLQVKSDSVKMDQVYHYIFNYGNLIVVPIVKDMMVSDSNNKSFVLGQLVKTPKIIFHFDETNCFDCVEKYLPYLTKLSAKIGKGNVIILGSFEKPRNLFLTLKGYDLKTIPIYNLDPSYLGNTRVGMLNMPYVFQADSLMRTTRFFIPEKALPSLSDLYNTNTSILKTEIKSSL